MVQQATDLHFLAKLLTFDLDKGSGHSLLVGVEITKSDPPAANWVPVLVRVYSSIHHTLGKKGGNQRSRQVFLTSKQITKDSSQPFSIEHPMQSTNKDRFSWIKPLQWPWEIVGVPQHPRNYLNLCNQTESV